MSATADSEEVVGHGYSVHHTWIDNPTERSVVASILVHFMVNLVGVLVEGDARVEWTRTSLTVAVAAVTYSGARTVGRHPRT